MALEAWTNFVLTEKEQKSKFTNFALNKISFSDL